MTIGMKTVRLAIIDSCALMRLREAELYETTRAICLIAHANPEDHDQSEQSWRDADREAPTWSA
jgi:hypothetical protein